MKFLNAIKRLFTDDVDKESHYGAGTDIAVTPDLPPLTAYETRKKDVEESAGPIEGIFYLHDGRIIPDYYSECLFSDKDNPCRKEMYHFHFSPNYMRRKFADKYIPDEKFIPRGRIAGTAGAPFIFIDKCYEQDADILRQLRELYRLPDVKVVSNPNYRCPACYKHDMKSHAEN